MNKGLVYSFIAVAFVLTASSCGSIKPEPPTRLITEVAPSVETVTNQIVVPLEINLSSYFKQANNQIPKVTKGADYPCSGIRYIYEFTKDSFEINTKNNELKSELFGSYWIKMEYCAGCTDLFTSKPTCMTPVVPFSCGVNEKKPSLKIELATQIGVSKDYSVQSKTRIEQIKSLNPCEVTLFRFDATSEVMKEVRKTVEKQSIALDKQLENISFKKDAQEIWKNLNQNIQIPYLGTIHFIPTNISLVNPKFSDNMLNTILVLDCKTFLDQSNSPNPQKPLPDLKVISKAPKDTFEVVTDFQLNYDSLSTLFSDQIKGKTLDLQGKKITFNRITVSGLNQHFVLLAIDFSGSKKGTLYLQGIPSFDNKTKVFSLDQLTYDIKTSSLLVKTAKWLFNNRIYNELKKASQISLQAEFEEVKSLINKNLSQRFGDYQLIGKAIDVSVSDFVVSKESLFLKANLSAHLKIKNNQ